MSKKGGFLVYFRTIFVILILISRFFYYQNVLAIETQVIINEIAWMGTNQSANDEWIELYNSSSKELVLDGWKLIADDGSPEILLQGSITAGGYYLLERTDDESVPNKTADCLYSGALGNTGEYLKIINTNNEIVDFVDARDGWPAGDNVSKETMGRSISGDWQTQSASPGEVNKEMTEDNTGITQDDENSENNNQEPTAGEADNNQRTETSQLDKKYYRPGTIVINEIVSDPEDSETEWLELYNTSQETIYLDAWYIEDGAGSKTVLSGSIGTGVNDKYFVVASIKGNLNNAGDRVVLKDAGGAFIDGVSYGNWDDGNKEDNAVVPTDPNSIARKEDGLDSRNNKTDFVLTSIKTKGSPNKISVVDTLVPENKNSALIISEIFPNPSGEDTKFEFVELYNTSEEIVDLENWQIVDEAGTVFVIKNQKLGAKAYLSLDRAKTKIVLNNSGDKISLIKAGAKKATHVLEYSEALVDMSLNCLDEEENRLGVAVNIECEWSQTVTMGKKNIITVPNRAPVLDFSLDTFLLARTPIIFDASDTFDPDEDELEYAWDFGDGYHSKFVVADHIYSKAGKYQVVLTANDGEFEEKLTKEIVVMDWDIDYKKISTTTDLKLVWDKLKISSFIPDPEGSDTDNEWVKIVNTGEIDLDLLDWQVDDAEGGSKPFLFKENFLLSPGQEYLLSREDSGLALNNNQDEIRLIAPGGEVVDLALYQKSEEGAVFVKDSDGNWTWQVRQSNDEKNIAPKIKIVKSGINSLVTSSELTKGAYVKRRGVVAVEPGVLSSQYFYIISEPSLQVYSYYKDFPDLKIGDVVEVSGEVSVVNNEYRIKTKTKNDILVLENNKELKAESMSCEEINKLKEVALCETSGEVVAKKGDKLYIHDGSDELEVFIKSSTNISLASIEKGSQINIVGLSTNSSSGKRLEPRSPDDIKILDSQTEENGQIMGAVAENSEWTLDSRNKKKEAIYYFLSILIFFVALGAVLYFKKAKT